MCDPVTATVATIGVASSAVGYAEQSAAASANLAHQEKQGAAHAEYVERSYNAQEEYQNRVADYQQETYDDELSYRDELVDYQDKMQATNIARANDAAMRNYSEILTRLGQEEIAGAMEIEGIRKASRSQQATALADMAERGVDGSTADYLLDAIAQVELADMQAINQERIWRNVAYQSQLDTVAAQRTARIESGTSQPIAMPTLPAPQAPISEIGSYQSQLVQKPSAVGAILKGAGSVAGAVAAGYQPSPGAGAVPSAPSSGMYSGGPMKSWNTPSSVTTSPGASALGYGDSGWRSQSYRPSWVG